MGAGLALAFHAAAQPNIQQPIEHGKSQYFDIQKTTLYNSPGIPDPAGWEAFEAKRKADESRQTAGASRNTQDHSRAIRCSCVHYAKAVTGYSAPVGSARNWPVNSHEPAPGSVAVFGGGRHGHVAVVLGVDRDGRTFTVAESNYVPCAVTSGRVVSFDDYELKGFYKTP